MAPKSLSPMGNIWLYACIVTLMFVKFSCLLATEYYVSNSGSDVNNGQSPQAAWQTISKVNSIKLQPGDVVMFERGGVWRDELLVHCSGTHDKYITYASYGAGPRPQILGSEKVDNWEHVQGNIWRSGNELLAPRQRTGNATTNHPASIFFGQIDGTVTWGNMEAIHLNSEGAPKDICERDRDNGFALMDKEYDWCWGDGYIYVYSIGNPGDKYAYVEVPQRSSSIYMETHKAQEYIKIENLELMFALKYGIDGGWPMAYEKHGLIVKNCHIAYMGTKGAASAIGIQLWHSDVLIQGNDIHDCGRRNISYNVYSDTRTSSLVFENVVFDNNFLHNGYHTTGIDINGGYADVFRNFVISNNQIWDNPNDDPTQYPNDFTSMGLYLNSNQATFTGFKVYNNVMKYIKQKHISANALKDSYIVHNTFYGMNSKAGGSGYRQIILVSGQPESFSIENNIFFGTINDEFVLSAITFSDHSATGSSVNHNLYYHVNERQRTITINETGNSYRLTQWNDYLDDTGWDLQSPSPTDPQFANPADNLMLLSSSVAIGAGTYYAAVSKDINGHQRQNPPCLGAYTYDASQIDSEKIIPYGVIYPNPTTEYISFATYGGQWPTHFRVFDLSGRVVLEQDLIKGMQQVPLANLSNGVYLVEVEYPQGQLCQKIIKTQ